jgi:hypothetical protein
MADASPVEVFLIFEEAKGRPFARTVHAGLEANGVTVGGYRADGLPSSDVAGAKRARLLLLLLTPGVFAEPSTLVNWEEVLRRHQTVVLAQHARSCHAIWIEAEQGDKAGPEVSPPKGYLELVYQRGLRHIPFLIEYLDWFVARVVEQVATTLTPVPVRPYPALKLFRDRVSVLHPNPSAFVPPEKATKRRPMPTVMIIRPANDTHGLGEECLAFMRLYLGEVRVVDIPAPELSQSKTKEALELEDLVMKEAPNAAFVAVLVVPGIFELPLTTLILKVTCRLIMLHNVRAVFDLYEEIANYDVDFQLQIAANISLPWTTGIEMRATWDRWHKAWQILEKKEFQRSERVRTKRFHWKRPTMPTTPPVDDEKTMTGSETVQRKLSKEAAAVVELPAITTSRLLSPSPVSLLRPCRILPPSPKIYSKQKKGTTSSSVGSLPKLRDVSGSASTYKTASASSKTIPPSAKTLSSETIVESRSKSPANRLVSPAPRSPTTSHFSDDSFVEVVEDDDEGNTTYVELMLIHNDRTGADWLYQYRSEFLLTSFLAVGYNPITHTLSQRVETMALCCGQGGLPGELFPYAVSGGSDAELAICFAILPPVDFMADLDAFWRRIVSAGAHEIKTVEQEEADKAQAAKDKASGKSRASLKAAADFRPKDEQQGSARPQTPGST